MIINKNIKYKNIYYLSLDFYYYFNFISKKLLDLYSFNNNLSERNCNFLKVVDFPTFLFFTHFSTLALPV